MRFENERDGVDAGDRSDVAQEVEIQILVKRRVDGARRERHQQRVTVGAGVRHGLGADVAGGARLVLHHKRLAEVIGEPLADQARG